MKGICIIILNPNGSVVSHAIDFDGPDAAGFSAQQEQRRRSKSRALLAFAKSHLNHWMAAKATYEDAIDLWRLAETSGYQMVEIPIGYEVDPS